MIYIKAKNKATGVITVIARYLNAEMKEATKDLILLRKQMTRSFLYIDKWGYKRENRDGNKEKEV